MGRKILVWLGIILFIGILIGAYFTFGSYSDGTRNGHIVKFSKKGVMMKTWEGELHLDCSRIGANPQPWLFSVSDETIANQVQQASLDNSCVNLYYKEKYMTFPWVGDSKYIIYKVEKSAHQN